MWQRRRHPRWPLRRDRVAGQTAERVGPRRHRFSRIEDGIGCGIGCQLVIRSARRLGRSGPRRRRHADRSARHAALEPVTKLCGGQRAVFGEGRECSVERAEQRGAVLRSCLGRIFACDRVGQWLARAQRAGWRECFAGDAKTQGLGECAQVACRADGQHAGLGARGSGSARCGFERSHQRIDQVAADLVAGGAGAEQQRAVIGEQQDVCRRDPAVRLTTAVDHLDRAEQGVEQRAQSRLVGGAGHLVAQLDQASAGIDRHHTVDAAERLEQVGHARQRRVVAVREHAGFVDEGATAARDHVVMPRLGCAQMQARIAAHQARGQVLLNRHRHGQRVVGREIDDRAAAAPEHALDLEAAKPQTAWQAVLRTALHRSVGGHG